MSPQSEPAPLVAAGAFAAVAASFLLGPVAACLVAAGGVLLQRSVRRRRTAADARREQARALDALSMLGAELRAGRTPSDAFDAAAGIAFGPSSGAFRAAAAAARLGGDVGAVLTAVPSAVRSMLVALAACWQVCSDAGSGFAAAVEQLEEGLRAAEAQRRAVAAELAGARATAQLLAVLPVVGVALAAGLGADPLRVLLWTPFGVGCLVVGLTLDGLGLLWTRRLTERAMP
ncbi:MAG: tight adherence protein [Actinomycetota bacterium]|nr:tight adherence protein [Actinomycetota bacterium]